jgi:hypothetical protein
MSEPDAVEPSDAPSNDAEYLWWWPSGAASPLRVGPALDGVDSVSIDQRRQRVALSFYLGKDSGVAILDLASGRLQRSSTVRQAAPRSHPTGRRSCT